MNRGAPSPLSAPRSLPGDAAERGVSQARPRRVYLALLTWAFTLFNTARMVAYFPTMWAIHQSGDASQHSLWTWCTWMGANATMALWLLEQPGGRPTRAIAVSSCNALLCAATIGLILAYR